MADPNNNKMSRIERAQKRLYAKDFTPDEDRRSDLEKKEYNVSTNWGEDTSENVGGNDILPPANLNLHGSEDDDNGKKKVFSFWGMLIFSIIFFIGAVGYAAWIFMGGGHTVSADNININIVGPVSVGGGDKLSLDVVIQNNNSITLEAADLVVTYPDGTKATDLITDIKRERVTIGNITPGEVVKETLDMAFFGEEGDNKRIEVDLEYKISGSLALFNKPKAFEIALNAAPVHVLVDGLERVSAGQEVVLDIEILSNSEKDIENLMLIANYPFGFKFTESTLEPAIGNNIWVFDKFSPTQYETFQIKGTIDAQDNEIRFFRFDAGIVSEENSDELGIIFTNTSHEISVEKPFIDLQLVINEEDGSPVVVSSGEQVFVVASFINSTNNPVSDVEIKLTLEGDILNKGTVSVEKGFYDSFDNTILFDKNNASELAQIEPRDQEQFRFTFRTKTSQVGISSSDIKISAEVNGRRISDDSSEESINETDLKIVKVLSDVLMQPFTLFDLGPFTNTGPVPPKAETDTTYTILLSVSNNLNDLQNTKLEGVLPPYVSWNDVVSPSNENVSYDSISRKLVWNIGDISAGVGHTGNPREVNFQITLRPSVSQIGDAPNLLNNLQFSAFDTFAGIDFSQPIDSPTTLLQEQAGAINKHQIVVE